MFLLENAKKIYPGQRTLPRPHPSGEGDPAPTCSFRSTRTLLLGAAPLTVLAAQVHDYNTTFQSIHLNLKQRTFWPAIY